MFPRLWRITSFVWEKTSSCKSLIVVCAGTQGLMLGYNFNQYEAYQSFALAAELDPSSAMASWGVAWSLGPGANRCALLLKPGLEHRVCQRPCMPCPVEH